MVAPPQIAENPAQKKSKSDSADIRGHGCRLLLKDLFSNN